MPTRITLARIQAELFAERPNNPPCGFDSGPFHGRRPGQGAFGRLSMRTRPRGPDELTLPLDDPRSCQPAREEAQEGREDCRVPRAAPEADEAPVPPAEAGTQLRQTARRHPSVLPAQRSQPRALRGFTAP